MEKRALVLSGGGAKGAFQAGALEHILVEKKMKFDIVCGVSVGALNATMVAQGEFDLLKRLWMEIVEPCDVYKARFGGEVASVLLGEPSFYNFEPLKKKIEKYVDMKRIQATGVQLRIGVVSLTSGQYITVTQNDSSFKQMLLASATIPVAFPPVDVSVGRKDLVDGGVRDQAPLATALETAEQMGYVLDELVVVLCNPLDAPPEQGPFKRIVKIGLRTLDLILNETFREDVAHFKWVNDMLQRNPGVKLTTNTGREMKHIPLTLIEPPESPNDTLGFERDRILKAWDMGLRTAKQVVP